MSAIHNRHYARQAIEGLVEVESGLRLLSAGLMQVADEGMGGEYYDKSDELLECAEEVLRVQQRFHRIVGRPNTLPQVAVKFKGGGDAEGNK